MSLVNEESNGRIVDLESPRRPFCVVGAGSERVFTTSASMGSPLSASKFRARNFGSEISCNCLRQQNSLSVAYIQLPITDDTTSRNRARM